MRPQKTSPFSWAALSLLITLLAAAASWGATLGDYTFSYSDQHYLIKSATDLNNLASYVNAGNNCEGLKFKLTKSITVSNYTPIGNGGYSFDGTFDGNGDTITIISYNQTPFLSSQTNKYRLNLGVFGKLYGQVRNLTVRADVSDIYLRNREISHFYFGGIVGESIGGKVINCRFENTNSSNTGIYLDSIGYAYIGGIVGGTESYMIPPRDYHNAYVDSNTSSCSFLVQNLGKNYIGGIVGRDYNSQDGGGIHENVVKKFSISFSSLTSSKTFVGGITGQSHSYIKNNLVLNFEPPSIGKYGAIATYTTSFSQDYIKNNGYYNSGTDIGATSCDSYDRCGTPSDRQFMAFPVFKITTGTGITAKDSVLTYDNINYFRSSSTITISKTGGNGSASTGYTYGFVVDNGNVSINNTSGTSATFTMPSRDIAVNWAAIPIDYAITYNLNGGTNPEGAATTYNVETAVTLPTPSRDHYDFVGWFNNSSWTGNIVTSIAKGSTGDKEFFAKWSAKEYTITYNLNGGTNPEYADVTYTVESSEVWLPTPSKLGYFFGGWYTDESFGGEKVTSILSGSSGDTTFYAKWTPISYTVYFYANGGDGEQMLAQQFTYDVERELNANTYTPPQGKGGFLEWNESYDGSGNRYSDRELVKNLSSSLNGRIYLYAQWKTLLTEEDIYIDNIGNVTYTGEPREPAVTIVDIAHMVDISDKFIVSYQTNTNVGLATAIITVDPEKMPGYDGTFTKSFNIVKATPNVTEPVANVLAYNGEAQALITAGSTDFGTLLYSLDGENYSEEIPSAVNAGTYTIYYKVEETRNFNGVEGSVEATISGNYTKFACVEINEIDGNKYATIDGNYTGTDALDITEDTEGITVVKFNRTFTTTEGNNFSTITLPFEVSTSQLSGVNRIVEFSQVGKNEETGVMQVEVNPVWKMGDIEHATLSANKPYMIQMNAEQLTISGTVTLKKTEEPIVTTGKWSFVGTYAFTRWDENNSESGLVYGFSATSFTAKDGEDYGAGQFIKFSPDSYIKPLRAYLRRNLPQQNAPSPLRAASIASIESEELPDRMNVVIVEKDNYGEEHTTVIGTLNTRTGEIRLNRDSRTFDLKGRSVGKQKAKGMYLKK